MKTAFLLGAGASKGAGLPLADDLTGKVLNDEFDILKSGNNPPDQQSTSQSILPFLRWIKVQVGCAGTSDSSVLNYEDFAYMAAQVRDHLLREYDNPAVHPLIQKALSEVWPLLSGSFEPRRELREIADKTVRYISNVVVQAVTNHATDFNYFHFLTKVPPQCNEGTLNIFSLNNDTLVEQFLLMNGKRFIDGFDPALSAEGGQWKPMLFEESAEADMIRLFKVHGSINWFRYRPDGENCRDEFRRIRVGNAALQEYLKLPLANRPADLPEILLGTFNKMLQYTGVLYLPLHYWFYRELETMDALVVCGYSFGEKGINQRIVNWLDGKQHRKMAIIDACTEEELWKKARKVMCLGRERWLGNKQLALFLKNKLECVNWNDVWRRIK